MAASKEDILEGIGALSVMDVAWLVKELETKFGVSAAAPVTMMAAPTDTVVAEAVEEKTDFSVILKDIGPNKINVIKAVREVTSLGLKEAKDLVEAAPKAVVEHVAKEAADETKKKLEASGATIEIT